MNGGRWDQPVMVGIKNISDTITDRATRATRAKSIQRQYLRFDLFGRYDNPWNRTVIEYLADELERLRRELPDGRKPPKRPRWYLEHLLTEKFKRCKT